MTGQGRPRIGRFEVLSRLGAGGQGQVFLALDPQLQRKVAVKLLPATNDSQPACDKLLSEARIVARLSHPNIIPVFEAGVHKHIPYLVIEYVEGATLRHLLGTRGSYAEDQAIPLMLQVLEGLAVAHAQGVMHLDLSPSNLMQDISGRLRIMDFGLARLVQQTAAAEQAEHVAGTPRYMSPEHFATAEFTPATDVFALGLIFFELLTGAPAISGDKISEIAAMLKRGNFAWTALHQKNIPPELVALLRDALAINPSTRLPDAGAMLQVLRDVITVRSARDDRGLAVQFLLRRLQRRPEFPAFSNSIEEINRLTADDANSGTAQLAAVIMRDYGLSNRLMKVANSAFFNRGAEGIRTISQAVGLLGTKHVRMLSNGLVFFDRMRNDNRALQDAMVGSFIAGMIARYLAGKHLRELAEEAFVCGLFHRLGRNLLIYYLEEEHEEIEHRVASGRTRQRAELEVLGTTCASVGAAVAGHWKFPQVILAAMESLPPGTLARPADALEAQCHLANFANELCDLCLHDEQTDPERALAAFGRRYQVIFPGRPQSLVELLRAAGEKFAELGPALGVNCAESQYLQRLRVYVDPLTVDAMPDQAALG